VTDWSRRSGDGIERTPRALGLPSLLEVSGFNVAGALAAQTYDRLVPPAWRCEQILPGARRALVLGCGGRGFGRAALQSPELRGGADPVDRFAARVMGELESALERRGGHCASLFAYERRGGVYADFVRLARTAGLGAPSRLGLLLHPRFGPWWSIRAVVLTTVAVPTTPPLAGFDPCHGCPAPCETVCPVDAPAPSGFDVRACAGYRSGPGPCRDACAARRACPVGEAHRYAPRIERIHMAASALWLDRARETRRG
jgi:hypothetical protein